MRMRNRRILPATCPSTSWPLSSCTRNMAFGSASTTSPSNSTFSSFAKRSASSDRPYVRGLRALGALAELVLDLRALGQGPEPVALERREVHERVLTAVIRRDEPEALLVAEPLHDSCCHLVQPSAPTRRFIPSAAARAPRRAALGLGARRDRLGLGRPLRRALVLVRVELRAAGGVLLVLRLGLL